MFEIHYVFQGEAKEMQNYRQITCCFLSPITTYHSHLCAPTQYNKVTGSIFNAILDCGEQFRALQVSPCYETGLQFSCL